MKTDHPFEPASTPGRKPYRFPPSFYHLCVQKADVQSAPGGGILRRVVKLVFAVFCVRAEAEALGVELAAASPRPRGWLPCRAVGRVDRNPSAALDVGSEGLRGLPRALGDPGGRATSFFNLAVTTGPPPRRPACLGCPEVPRATGPRSRVVLVVPRGSPGRFERHRRPAALRCCAKSVKKNARGFFLASWIEVLGSRNKLPGKDLQKQKRSGLLECSREEMFAFLAGNI